MNRPDIAEARRLADQMKERYGASVPTSQAAAMLRALADENERLRSEEKELKAFLRSRDANIVEQNKQLNQFRVLCADRAAQVERLRAQVAPAGCTGRYGCTCDAHYKAPAQQVDRVTVPLSLVKRAQQAINWHLEPASPAEHQRTMLELSEIAWPGSIDPAMAQQAEPNDGREPLLGHLKAGTYPPSWERFAGQLRVSKPPAQQAEEAAARDNATLERGIQLGMYRERQRAEALAQQAEPVAESWPCSKCGVQRSHFPACAQDGCPLMLSQPPAQGVGRQTFAEWSKTVEWWDFDSEGRACSRKDARHMAALAYAAARAQAPAAEPHGWVTWWTRQGGGRSTVYSHGPERPNYGPELNALLRIYPVYDKPAA